MKNFISKIKYKKLIGFSIIFIPLLVLFATLILSNNYIRTDNRVTDGYHEIHNITKEIIEDDDAPQGIVKKYTMTIDEFHTNANCLAFRVIHHYAKVYIGGELVHNFSPTNVGEVGDTLGCDWIIVPLVPSDNDKVVVIELTPVYFDVVGDEVEFYHGAQYDIFIDILLKDIVWLLISLACLCVGAVLIIGYLYSRYNHKAHNTSFIYLGLVALLISFWKLFDMNLAPLLFEGNPRLLFYLSYISLMLTPLPFIKYVDCLLKNKNNFAIKLLYVVYFTVVFVALVLQLFNAFDIRQNIALLLCIIVATIIAVVIIVFVDGEFIRKRANGSIKQLLPLFLGVLSFGGVLDIILYFVKESTQGLPFTFTSFFLYSLIVTINSISEGNKRNYRDFQTGLYNSNSCTEFISENSNMKNCAVMMIDLNGLKHTNDTYGHAAGDRLIIDLTTVLKKSIPVDDFIGRYGGDEFIAIISNCNSDRMNRIVDNLEKYKNECNVDRLPALSFAYGWALSNEHVGDLSELLKIADKNMYAHKELQKKHNE